MSYTTTTFLSTDVTVSEVAEAFGDVGGSDVKFSEYYDRMSGAGASDKGLSEMFGNAVIVLVTGNENNFNLFTAAGSPSAYKHVLCIVESGVVIAGTSTGTPAFNVGSGWNVSTTIRLENNGLIHAKGGAGGRGETDFNVGGAGLPGGKAINLLHDLSIVNASGYIFGGGGGGGGGGPDTYYTTSANGGGGGGGAGGGAGGGIRTGNCDEAPWAPPTVGTAGTSGQSGSGGAYGVGGYCNAVDPDPQGGHGGLGGGYGAAGSTGQAGQAPGWSNTAGGAGGAAGNAVALNGNAVTWISGNTAARVKGPIS